jgi:hypothetical protein
MQKTEHVNEEVADVIYSQGYDPREFHRVIVQHEERFAEGVGRMTSARYMA